MALSDEFGRGDALAARKPHRVTDWACEEARRVLEDAADVSVSVPSVTVFSSTLTSSGPRYERLESVDLGAS